MALLLPAATGAQGLTGALIGTVKDDQGAVVVGARVRISSPSLIGGPATQTTNEKGQLRFPALSPGSYVLDVEMEGFAPYHEEQIGTRFGLDDLRAIPTRRASMFDLIRAAPGNLPHLADERHHHDRVRVRIRDQREPVVSS